MEGKVVLITGASTGLGLESAVQLAELGAKVILAVRNKEKAKQNLQTRVSQIIPPKPELDERLVIWPQALNLEDFDSIREFVESLKSENVILDVLMNNAGCFGEMKQMAKSEVEWTFAVNQLGPFLLTLLCIPLLSKAEQPRIVILSSSLHKSAGVTFDINDINWEKRAFDGMKAYSESKFANQLWSYALFRRVHPKIAVFSVHPGVVRTELARNVAWWKKALFIPIQYLFFRSVNVGARTQVFCASSPDALKDNGRYFGDCKAEDSSKESMNEDLQEAIWNFSVEKCGLTNEDVSELLSCLQN